MNHRRTFILILLICLAPVVAGYWLYYFGGTDKTVNYGELLEPAPLPAQALAGLDGRPFSLAQLKGRWIFLLAAPAACAAPCPETLYDMRQVRAAQGEHQKRIERVWLVTDGGAPDPRLLEAHAGLHVARASEAQRAALAAFGDGRVLVVDPLGNVMMRYPPQPEPKKMIKDFERLLKYSRIG